MGSINYGIAKNGRPAEVQNGLMFVEEFENNVEVSNNNGTTYGTPTFNQDGFTQNTNGDYIAYDEMNLGTVHSLILKVKLNAYGQADVGCAYVSGNAGNYFLFNDSTKLYYQASTTPASAEYVVPLNQEVTISITRNNTSVKFYVDGVLVSTKTLSANTDLIIDRIGRYTSATYTSDATYGSVKMFNTELSQADILAYSDDSMFNYENDAELILPMGLAQHDPSYINPTEVINDGDMEASGTSDWDFSVGDVLTKEPSTLGGGTQCLRVAYGSANNPYAAQSVCKIGKTYHVTGYGRGDGTYIPVVGDGTAANLFFGTPSNEWQYFDFVFTQVGSDVIFFRTNITSAGYVEWNNVSIEEYEPRTLDVSGKGNHAILGGGLVTAMPTKLSDKRGSSFDGGDYLDLGVQDFSGDFSFVTKVSTDNIGSTSFIAGTSTTLSATLLNGWAIYLGTTGTIWTFQTGDGSHITKIQSAELAQAKKEYTLGISWNNITKTLTAYINGINIGSHTNTSIGDINVNNNFNLGRVLTSYLTGKNTYNLVVKKVLSDIQMENEHLKINQSINNN